MNCRPLQRSHSEGQSSTLTGSRHQTSLTPASTRMSISSVLNDPESSIRGPSHHPNDMINVQYARDIPFRPSSPPYSQSASYPPTYTDGYLSGGSNNNQTIQPRPSVAPKRRAPRPAYTDEEIYFIWYYRTDLGQPWDKVLTKFQRQPEFVHPRTKGGLQCRFYRVLDQYHVEKVREQASARGREGPGDMVGRYGVVQRTWERFPWMRGEHFSAKPLEQFRGQPKRSLKNTRATAPESEDDVDQ